MFDGDYRGCYMHKQGYENEGKPTICKEFSILYMEDRVSVDHAESQILKQKQFLKTQLLDGQHV